MPRYLLDTNICISIRQKRPPKLIARFADLASGEACLSVITFGELARGVEQSANPHTAKKVLAELVGLIPVLPLPVDAGLRYGSVRAALESSGTVIRNNDPWIAAHALSSDLVLVTNNEGSSGGCRG